MKESLLLVDLDKNKKKHLALYQSINEYQTLKKEMQEFQKKEKELKDKIKECGYEQIIFKSNDEKISVKIQTIESNITKLNQETLKNTLRDEIVEYIRQITDHTDGTIQNNIDNILEHCFLVANENTLRKQVRIDVKNGK